MKKLYYLLDFSDFSIGVTNEEKKVRAEDLSYLYFNLKESAEEFANNNSLHFELTPATSTTPTVGKEIFHYCFGNGGFNKERFIRHLNWLKEKKKIPIYQIRIRTLIPLEELIGRENILDNIFSSFTKNHISLKAPRCYGKTSILNAISPPGWKTIFLQMHNLYTPQGFVGEIAYEISQDSSSEKMRERYEEESKKDWTKTLMELLGETQSYLLLLDEFTEFLRHLKEINKLDEFLKGFELIAKQENIRFISASSKSEERIIGRKLTYFQDINIPLLNQSDAKLLLEELAYNSGIIPKEGEINEICNLIKDFVPYFLHIFVDIWNEMRKTKSGINIKEVYDTGLNGKIGWNLLRDFQNLRDYPPKLHSPALEILYRLTQKERLNKAEIQNIAESKGISLNEIDDLIDRMEEDLLIKKDDDNYLFFTKVLKDFWCRFPKR